MKAIFLCDSAPNVERVYDASVVARLQALTDIEATTYTKADVLADPAKFADVEAVFSTWGMPGFSEEEIKACLPALKCVFYAAGSVQAFARPFLHCGVKVFSAWAANAVPVAEYTVSQIILSNKGFFAHARLLGQSRMEESHGRLPACIGNFRAKVGLIGCGMIGSLVAEMLKAYDVEVLAFDPFLSDEKAKALGVTLCSLDQLFSSCTVVSNHLANNAETRGMLTYEHFSAMRPYATFLNTGRGAQVVEEELVRALTERKDLTAVLDVTDPEPSPLGHPFYTLPNCFLTPHIAGSLGGEVVRMAEYMVDEYTAWTEGRPVRYDVTLKMLETMA
jgi:phosphoglycerate dehydrogenase-like enzyme